MDRLAIDCALSFPTSPRGNNILLIVVDVCTRFVFLRPMPDKSDRSVALSLLSIFIDFGFPKILQSDNASEFVNTVMKQLTAEFLIDHRLITPYHPRANGLAERFVQTACRSIKKLLEGDEAQWDLHVPVVQFAINSKVADIHGSTPFSVMFARQLNPFTDYTECNSDHPSPKSISDRLQFIHDILFPAVEERSLNHAALAKAKFHRRFKISSDPFPNGCFVMVKDPIRSSSLQPFFEGPFKVLRRTRGGSYMLLDTDNILYPRPVAPIHMKLVSSDRFSTKSPTSSIAS
jgi:hypothetical protein